MPHHIIIGRHLQQRLVFPTLLESLERGCVFPEKDRHDFLIMTPRSPNVRPPPMISKRMRGKTVQPTAHHRHNDEPFAARSGSFQTSGTSKKVERLRRRYVPARNSNPV